MKAKKLHITILLFLIWSFSCAQQYTHYNTKNGLPSNHVYRITQDYQGFIWIITDKGMVKYNGTNFKEFTIRDGLPTNDIWNIVTTPNGKVWYFSKSPKIGYIDKDSIYAFPSTVKDEIFNPMNRNIVGNEITFNNSINHYELKNNHWESKSIYGVYSPQKEYRTFLKHNKLDRFQFSKNKPNLLFFDKKEQLIKKIKFNFEITMSHTRGQVNDSIYVWLSDASYSILNLNNFKLKTTFFKDVIRIKKSKYVRMHVVNNQIQITGKGFVSVLDKNFNLVNIRYIPSKLKAHFSFIDKQDNLWVATFTNGVYKLPKSKQNAAYNLINEKVGKIKKVGNHLITTVLDKGFYQYDSGTKHFTLYRKETNYAYGVFDVNELNTKYFITSNKITSIYKGSESTLYTLEIHNFLNETARQLVFFKGYLYGNFTNGLNKLNLKNLNVNKEYLSNGIRTFLPFKNKLIIATSNGLKVLKNDSIQALVFKESSKLYAKPILSLNKLEDNVLLVGTDSYGAFLTNLKTITPLKETQYLSINDSFYEHDNLWIATNIGVLHYKKDAINNYKFITRYTENDGLLLKNANSVYVINNELIVSSNGGVSIIPIQKENALSFIDIYVDRMQYNSKKIKNTAAVQYVKNNTFEVTTATIDFSENENLNYSYQLAPIQNHWTQTTSKQISFADLQPNTYQLNLKSNNKTKQVTFIVQPLWWQTNSFKIGLVILCVLLLYFLSKRYQQKLKKDALVLQKMAEQELYALRSQMNPHFVFNSLSAIQYYINENNFEASETYLIKFSRLIRSFFELAKEKEITLKDEIKLLQSYLEIEKLRFKEKLSFEFSIDSKLQLHKTKIPTMLLQPIVENAVNHGVFNKIENGKITLNFIYLKEDTFKVEIIDDGVGIVNTKNRTHKNKNSSQVLQNRLKFLNTYQSWNIKYKMEELHPQQKNKGNISTFTITKL